MNETIEKVTVTDFIKNIKKFTQDPDSEVVLTRNSIPIGTYIGIDTWHAMQESFDLLREHPEELLRSLALHQRLKKTGKPEGISLKELTSKFEQRDQ